MENRKKLHDWGLVLIVLGIANLFVFVGTIVDSLVKGEIAAELATVEADIVVAVKVVLIVIAAIMACLVGADILLGIKALKVSKNPDASKGYITVATIFMLLSCVATLTTATTIWGGNGSTVDACLSLSSSTLNICIYLLFINAAKAVRQDVLNCTK